MGILGVPKNYLIEISENHPKVNKSKLIRRKKKSITFYLFIFCLRKANPLSWAMKLTSFEITLSILKSSLVLTEANFIDRNCRQKKEKKKNLMSKKSKHYDHHLICLLAKFDFWTEDVESFLKHFIIYYFNQKKKIMGSWDICSFFILLTAKIIFLPQLDAAMIEHSL